MDEIYKIIDSFPLNDKQRTLVKLAIELGQNPTYLLTKFISDNLSKAREKEHPPIPSDYTEVERIIHEMLIENTGVHVLDSGDAYGRHWEANREVDDFRKLPKINVAVWRDGDIEVSVNIFHYLRAHLERDEKARDIEVLFYANQPENKDVPWLVLMEDFAELAGYRKSTTWNSYNWESILSQVIQGVSLLSSEDDIYDEYYILLQVHNGCDVRGGYTAPRVFKTDMRLFTDDGVLVMSCGCKTLDSDDGGYRWYNEDGDKISPSDLWKVVPKKENAENWEYKFVCDECGKDVEILPWW